MFKKTWRVLPAILTLLICVLCATSINQAGAASVGSEKTPIAQPLKTIDFYNLATGLNFKNIVKYHNPVIDPDKRRMYFTSPYFSQMVVFDIDNEQVADEWDMGVPGGHLFINSQKEIYLYNYENGDTCRKVDTDKKSVSDAESSVCTALARATDLKSGTWNGYKFTMGGFSDTIATFPTTWRQDLDGAFGVMDITKGTSTAKLGEIVDGIDSIYFIIDQKTGKLFTTETGFGHVGIYDLNKLESTNYCQNNGCFVKRVRIGIDGESIVNDSKGNIYIRDRHGSQIYKYNTASSTFSVYKNILDDKSNGISLWPVGLFMNPAETKLFTFSHFGALVDVIDLATGQVNKIKFYPNYASAYPRMDGISHFQQDKTNGKYFASIPELGKIIITDENKVLKTIDLTNYGYVIASTKGGPGRIQTVVNEKTNKIFVFIDQIGKIITIDGDNYSKESEISTKAGGGKGEDTIISNDEKNELYLGDIIYAQNKGILTEKSRLEYGDMVVGYNNARNAIYAAKSNTTGRTDGSLQEILFELIDKKAVKQWNLDAFKMYAQRFSFDYAKNQFQVMYLGSGMLKTYDLGAGGTVDTTLANTISSGGQTAYDKCDTDQNGTVSSEEKSKCSGTGTDTSTAETCDYNSDGKVDELETAKCQAAANSTIYDTDCDYNKDGRIDGEEKKKCIAEKGSIYKDGTKVAAKYYIDQQTILLLHGDGSGAISDSSGKQKSIASIGKATNSKSQYKFGNSSLYFDGNNSYLNCKVDPDYGFGSGNFTIDFWARPTVLDGKRRTVVNTGGLGQIDGIFIGINNKNQWYYNVGNGTNYYWSAAIADAKLNTWQHIALVRDGNNFKFFIDGSLKLTSGDIKGQSVANTNYMFIGRKVLWGEGTSSDFSGYIDEFQISRGVARWQGNFTPPSSAYAEKTSLSGNFLIKTESKGEAYYVDPFDGEPIYLSSPTKAFNAISLEASGITQANLDKIQIGVASLSGADTDKDGLPDNLEKLIGTNMNNSDSDKDGFKDGIEVQNGYDPSAADKKENLDKNFSKKQAGRIFINVEGKGEMWYVSPVDNKRYLITNAADLWNLLQAFAKGISNNDFNSSFSK